MAAGSPASPRRLGFVFDMAKNPRKRAAIPAGQLLEIRPPRPETAWFTRDRFGLFIHWGLYSLGARHEWLQNREELSGEAYRRYFDQFDPDLYDPVAWAAAAKAAGMRYAVITAKHHEGFCLWDSACTDYKAAKTPCGRDLLKPFVEAFRAAGLRVGFYYSLIDWHHPDFTVDQHHPLRGDPRARAANARRKPARYAAYMRDQVRELLTQFGRIDLMWFDFSYPGPDGKGRRDWESEKLFALVQELQPHVLVDNRLDLPGSGDFVTPEQYVPEDGMRRPGGEPLVWEACHTFSGSWGYHRDEHGWKSVGQLVRMLVHHVSRGGNLLLNVGPTGRGEFDPRASERLAGLAEWMRRHGRAIHGCGRAPEGLREPRDARYTWDAERRRLYLHLFAWPFKEVVLPGLAGRVRYAQFLHDASELRWRDAATAVHPDHNTRPEDGDLVLELPTEKPPAEVPVVELTIGES
jgi:alpha-L-fucosidase